jgi:hypothetical protein
MFVGYHVAVESRLAFRDVEPHVALYVWIPAVALTALLWPAALIAAAKPQIRGRHQVLPLSSEDGLAGAGERRHLRGPPGGSLLHLRPLKSGRADLQRCKTLDALGGVMARGRPTSARPQACGGLDGATALGHPLTP